jgi:hypothetical protein
MPIVYGSPRFENHCPPLPFQDQSQEAGQKLSGQSYMATVQWQRGQGNKMKAGRKQSNEAFPILACAWCMCQSNCCQMGREEGAFVILLPILHKTHCWKGNNEWASVMSDSGRPRINNRQHGRTEHHSGAPLGQGQHSRASPQAPYVYVQVIGAAR